MVRNGLKSLFALFFLNKVLIVNSIVVTPEYPKKNDPVILAANASGLPTVTWQKNNSILTSCYLQAGICGDETILPGANIKIDQTTNITTIEIASANQSFYGGVYTASGSTNVNLIINTLPASMNWTTQPQGNLTTVSSATWTAKIYCVYPTSSVKVDFTVFVEGIKEVSSRSLALSNETDPICDSPEKTIVASLTLSSSEFRNKKVYIIANASHASFPNEPSITSGQSVETTFQVSSSQSCSGGRCCYLLVCVVIIVVDVVFGIIALIIHTLIPKSRSKKTWGLAMMALCVVAILIYAVSVIPVAVLKRKKEEAGYCCKELGIYLTGVGCILLSIAFFVWLLHYLFNICSNDPPQLFGYCKHHNIINDYFCNKVSHGVNERRNSNSTKRRPLPLPPNYRPRLNEYSFEGTNKIDAKKLKVLNNKT